MRESEFKDVALGDSVYYKRNDSNVWRGPAVVIGRDGKQILVKHGGACVRVHVCRIRSSTENKGSNVEKNESKDVYAERVHVNKRVVESDSEEENANKPETDSPGKSSQADLNEYARNTFDNGEREESIVDAEENQAYDYKNARKGDRITGIHIASGELISGMLRSRAGKLNSKHQYCWNLDQTDGETKWYDLSKGFKDIKKVADDAELLIFFQL